MRAARKKRILRILVLLMAAALLVFAGVRRRQSREGIRFVKTLGSGINLGNSLDAHGITKYKDDPGVEDFETFWHNPPISDALLKAVKAAGFTLVRIPVTWEEHMDGAGQVDAAWMDRVDEVVRMALRQNLHVILDTHHEAWLDLSADRETTEARFAGLWTQIARRFADCGEKLLFEGLNEPRLRDSELEWTAGSRELRAQVDRLNRIFAAAVRAEGGNNETRWLLIAPYANQTEEAAMKALTLPDRRCIAALHVYVPYDFCQNEEGESRWEPGGKAAQKLAAAFDRIRKDLTRRGIPVIITECGCVDKDNEADRALWAEALREGASRCHAPCVWWDNGSTYRLLDRETGEVLFPGLLQAFTKP